VAETFRIAILGSGPAGLSAAAHAAKKGLSHILLEKSDHVSDTIYRYQRGKYIMSTPNQLVLRSDCPFTAGKREVLLQNWDGIVKSIGINVRLRAEAKSISGTKGNFVVALADGEQIHAEHLILAVGTQSNPNLLRCPGANLPHVQYQLDDPQQYIDEHIFVIGAGDAGIENALGLVDDRAQYNFVTIVNRSADFARAKEANVKSLFDARDAEHITILVNAAPTLVEPDWITVETAEGSQKLKCDRVIARLGSLPPRKFVESIGVKFTGDSPTAYPQLSPTFETTVPGLYVIGALAGYPLIKHCMNQGYDVVEYISGNAALTPADEPILKEKFSILPGRRSVSEWLEYFRSHVEILNGLSPLQMREFMIDCDVRVLRSGETIFKRNDIGSSLFGIAEGSVLVEIDPKRPSVTVGIGNGSIFGEVGLISGRRRGSTVRAGAECIVLELQRMVALKLMATVPAARDTINRITVERQVLQIFGSGLSANDVAEVLASSELKEVKAGEDVIREGEEGYDIYIVRSGSMIVEKEIGGKRVFMSYIPAGSYFGEMALIDGGSRTATVSAAIKSEIVRLNGAAFRRLLGSNDKLRSRLEAEMATRRKVTRFIEKQKKKFGGVVDMYSAVAEFLVDQGIGEATDVLIIDELLCIGCDNCEKACADIHDGLSRLDREAGKTYAHLHVPTSCRHCEHPYCMTDCPPNAIQRGPDGEVNIDDSCIGCGNCLRYCPYGVIRMDSVPPKKPGILMWLLFGSGPGPGEPDKTWRKEHVVKGVDVPKVAVKCDMCAGKDGGPACVRACPTGAALRVSPESFLSVALLERGREDFG
jgi:Fe-S-cluster-containing hydrogenase component 2/thioredoxin reductase/CRP-like cAMP-binding protein